MRWMQTVDVRPHEGLHGRLQSASYAIARVENGDLCKPVIRHFEFQSASRTLHGEKSLLETPPR